MRPRLTMVAILAVALTAGTVTALPARRDPNPGTGTAMQLVAQPDNTGKPIVTNSLEGKPILTVADLRPGQSRSGQLTMTNAGSAPETVYLWQSSLTSGPAGRPNLAAWTQLTVYDNALGKNIYVGAYQDFPAVQSRMLLCGVPAKKDNCPKWARSEAHVFTFTVTFPDAARGSSLNINSYQSTWLRSEFDWASFI